MPIYCDGRPCSEGATSNGMTSEGGLTISLINKTGSPSVKGTVVIASTSNDNAFITAPVDADEAIGVVLDDGISDGEYCRIVISGKAQVLLENSEAGVNGYWVQCSDTTAGRAILEPNPVPATHWAELGHCIENISGGIDILAWCVLHFN